MRAYILTVLAAVETAYGLGSAVVLNNSTSPLYLWSVGGVIGPQQKVVPGGLYMEPLYHDERSGGVALKITKNAGGLYSGDPQQIFAYNVDGVQVWYDMSAVFGEPFLGHRIEVTSTTGSPIIWKNGANPGGNQVKVAPSDENIWFTVYGAA